MSYDLNILCVNQQRKAIEIQKEIKIHVGAQNDMADDNPKFYTEYCQFMNHVNGI